MTHHLYPFSDERSYFFDSMYDHNRLCHGSKTFFRQPNKDQVKLESMFTKIQVLLSVTLGAEVHSVLPNKMRIRCNSETGDDDGSLLRKLCHVVIATRWRF